MQLIMKSRLIKIAYKISKQQKQNVKDRERMKKNLERFIPVHINTNPTSNLSYPTIEHFNLSKQVLRLRLCNKPKHLFLTSV